MQIKSTMMFLTSFLYHVKRNFTIWIMKYMMKVPIIILLLLMKRGVMEISFVIHIGKNLSL